MKRKFLAVAVAFIAAFACIFGLTACNSSDSGHNPENGGNNSEEAQQQEVWGEVDTLKVAYATAQSFGYDGNLEEFIQSITGKDGKDGEDGVNGINGKDGEDGVGISKVEIVDGKLMVTLTNSQTIECGDVRITNNYDYCQHRYGEWSVGFAATCTSIGYNMRICETCGDIDYEFVLPVAHNFVVKDYDSEKHTVYCVNCGRTFEGEHSLNSYGDCIHCGKQIEGLGFVLNEDGNSYGIIGRGSFNIAAEIIIPSTYKNLPVTSIYRLGNIRFDMLAKLTIPVSVTYIGPAHGEHESPFLECSKLKNIYYEGTVKQWNAIEKSSNWNDSLTNCTVHCEDGDISI